MGKPRQHFERVCALLAERGEMRAAAIAEQLGFKTGTLHAATRVPERDGLVLRRMEGRNVYLRLPPAEPEVVPFNAARWSDGDVDLYGCIELDDGGVRLTPEMVGKLRELLGVA